MSSKVVDCRGLACPHPVINTKNALEEAGAETVVIIVDNDTARQNVTLFARNAGYEVTEEKEDGTYRLIIRKPGKAGEKEKQKDTAPSPVNETVYFITTNVLGQGSPDLGQVLIKSFFISIAAINPPPAALLFLNTGVFLTCEGSPVLEHLEKLQAAGTVIMSCGTCLEYYHIKEKLKVGKISNMMEIISWLLGPHRPITIA